MEIEIREIQHKSFDYDLEIALRSKILREPLGLQYRQEDLDRENTDLHLGAFVGSKLLGCLLLTPVSETKIKMRQVAVSSESQGLGIGRRLVEASERKAKALGFREIELHARETAVPFYLKLGYEVFGEPFVEVSLPHRKMRKLI